jgi:hypothetical protein
MKSIVLALVSLFTAGCVATGVAIATSVTAVSEVAASNCIQKKVITVAQLSTLTADLAKLPATPLPSSDNAVIANVISELLAKKQASLTQESVVDACNNAINSLNAATSASPTALQGILWASLQDVIGGFNAAVKNAQANPQLVPTAIYTSPAVNINGPIYAEVFSR